MERTWNGVERRSVPRIALGARRECRVVMRARVKVLDVSGTGALLATDAALPTGSVARLTTVLGAGPFTPVVEVVRTTERGRQERREFGVQFQGMDAQSQTQLDKFLSKASA